MEKYDAVSFILQAQREAVEKYADEVFSQPIDRIVFPIAKEEFTKFRDEAISRASKYIGGEK